MATFLDYYNTFIQPFATAHMIDIVSQAGVAINLGLRKPQFIEGGPGVQQPLIKSLPTNKIKSFRGPTTFDQNFEENEISAVFPMCYYGGSLDLVDTDIASIKGRKALGNLIKTRFVELEEALRQVLASQIWLDGTEMGGTAIVGAQAALDDGSNYPVYGGVDRDDYPTWGGQLLDATGNRALTTSLIKALQIACTIGSERPNIFFCRKEGLERLSKLIQPIQRAVTGDVGNWGFKNLAFENVPVVSDDFIPTSPGDSFYAWNTKWLQFWFLTGWFFFFRPIQWVPHTNTWSGQIMTSICPIWNNPRTSGRIGHLDYSMS